MLTVSIIVLNWNGRRFLEDCLRSLQAQTYRNFEVILVDNGSTDGSVELVRASFGEWLDREELPCLRLLELEHNSGFSGGNNAGLEQAGPAARYIATLNNDTQADPRWLETLVDGLENGAEWGAVCGPMLFAAGKDRNRPVIASAGIEVRQDGLALDRHLGREWQPGEEPEEIFGPCAGAALYRRSMLDEIGFFDPAFFAYLEDADLAWRMRLAGWRSLYLPGAVVWHEYSGTGGQGSPFKNFQLGRNRLWVIIKNWPGPLLRRHAWQILLYDFSASLYTLLKGNPHSLRGRLAALRPAELSRLRAQRQKLQRERASTIAELERWLAPAVTPMQTLRLRRKTDELAAALPS